MTEITEIFSILMEQFGTLAWWYALGIVITTWITIIILIVFMIAFIRDVF